MISPATYSSHTSLNHPPAFSFKPLLKLFAISIVIAFVLEIVIFNASHFYNSKGYPVSVVNVTDSKNPDSPGFVLNKKRTMMSINNLNLNVDTITLYAFVSGQSAQIIISDNDFGSSANLQQLATIAVPGTSTSTPLTISNINQNTYKVAIKVRPRGKVTSVVFNLINATPFHKVIISKVVFNEKIPLNFSIVRILLISLLLSIIFLVCFKGLRNYTCSLHSKSIKVLNAATLVFAFAFSVMLLLVQTSSLAHKSFITNLNGTLTEVSSNNTLFEKLPANDDAYLKANPYVKLLMAVKDGRLGLDNSLALKVNALSNPYNKQERAKANISETSGLSYYDHALYTYQGLAALIFIYLPIYFVSGLIPSAALASFIASVYAILGIFVLLGRVEKYFANDVNPLIFALGKLSLIMASGVYLLEAFMLHTTLNKLLEIALFTLSFALLLPFLRSLLIVSTNHQAVKAESVSQNDSNAHAAKAYVDLSSVNKFGALAAVGLCISGIFAALLFDVNVGFSLMLTLSFILSLSISVVTKNGSTDESSVLLKNALCWFLPFIVVSILMGVYNYVRFDGFFESGKHYLLGNKDYRESFFTLNPAVLVDALYSLMAMGFSILSNFPYISLYSQADMVPSSNYAQLDNFGIMSYPIFIFMLFVPILFILKLRKYTLSKSTTANHQEPSKTSDVLENNHQITPNKLDNQDSTHQSAKLCYQGIFTNKILMFSGFGTLFLLLALLLGVSDFIANGYTSKSHGDLVIPMLPFVWWLLLKLKLDNSEVQNETLRLMKASLYIIILLMMLKTIFSAFYLMFVSNVSVIHSLNPAWYYLVQNIFDPLNYTISSL